jgi:hypothetical protein
MTSFTFGGMTAIIMSIGITIVIAAVPVWFGAKVTDATNPTLIRSILALLAGTIGAIAGFKVAGGLGLLIAPISYLLSFKFILGTSLFGAMILGILSITGYFLMGKFMSSAFNVNNDTASYLELERRVSIHVAKQAAHVPHFMEPYLSSSMKMKNNDRHQG